MSDYFHDTINRFGGDDVFGSAFDDFNGAFMPAMKRRVPVNLDLVFAVDRTGSSSEFFLGIRRAIPMIAKPAIARAARVRLFLQTHGDLDYGQRPIMVLRDGSLDELMNEANRIVFGGGDAPGHHTHALEAVLDTVDWTGARPTRRAVVLFATADTKPSPSGCSLAQIADALLANRVLLFAVCEMEPGMQALIGRTQGLACAISNDPSEAGMQGIAAAVAASVLGS